MAKAKKTEATILPPSLAFTPIKREFFEKCGEAVTADGRAEHLWHDVVAPMAFEVYGDLESFEAAADEVKDYAIVPYLAEWARVAYTEKLPDARTKEGKAEGQKEKRAVRKQAQDKVSKIWGKLCEYAFGDELEERRELKRAESGEGEGEEGDVADADSKVSDVDFANKSLPTLKKKIGQNEAPTYDAVRASKLLDELIMVMNTPFPTK